MNSVAGSSSFAMILSPPLTVSSRVSTDQNSREILGINPSRDLVSFRTHTHTIPYQTHTHTHTPYHTIPDHTISYQTHTHTHITHTSHKPYLASALVRKIKFKLKDKIVFF